MFARMWNDSPMIRIAILDLYDGQPNQGMRCIREILNQWSDYNHLHIEFKAFNVRQLEEVPDLNYDIYISSGGPGDPVASKGTAWENAYFNWLTAVERWNNDAEQTLKKHVFFICHSYQLICREWNLGLVSKRRSTAFGVFPVHLFEEGKEELVFDGLKDPFYVVDSRDYQVTQLNADVMNERGCIPLCIEKARPHIDLDRAIMAIRFNKYMIGAQFHPEADAIGMSMYLQTEEKKKTVIENHGEEKWRSMLDHLNDPDKIMWTYARILPNFLNQAVEHMQSVTA